MPRTSWTPKNPYCRRSKLPKEAFESLLFHYLSNTGAQEAADLLRERDGVKISRQSVNKYFLNLGYHLFLNFYYPDALLIFLGDRLEREGWKDTSVRQRGLHYAYHTGFAETLIETLKLDRAEVEALHARILRIPEMLRRYVEDDTPAPDSVIETASDRAVLARLRDNHFLVTAIRMMRKRAYGYAGEHYLAYFGKAYFMDVFATPSEGAISDADILSTRWTPLTMRIWLGFFLGLHPMTLREPAEFAGMIGERLGASGN